MRSTWCTGAARRTPPEEPEARSAPPHRLVTGARTRKAAPHDDRHPLAVFVQHGAAGRCWIAGRVDLEDVARIREVDPLAASDHLADGRLRPRDRDVRDDRHPGADRERLRRRAAKRVEDRLVDPEEREIRLAVHSLRTAGRSTPPPRSTRTRPSGIATLADVMMSRSRGERGADQALLLPRARGDVGWRIRDDGEDAGLDGIDDSEERSVVGSGSSSAASRRRCSRPMERGHREEEQTRGGGVGFMEGVAGLPSEDDVHVIGGPTRDGHDRVECRILAGAVRGRTGRGCTRPGTGRAGPGISLPPVNP